MKLFFTLVVFGLLSMCTAADDECAPGHQYQQDCNTCTCTEKGFYICTLRACFDGPMYPDTPIETTTTTPTQAADEKCEKGSTKKKDCNFCKCTDIGGWVCTRKLCPPPGESFEPAPRQTRAIKEDSEQEKKHDQKKENIYPKEEINRVKRDLKAAEEEAKEDEQNQEIKYTEEDTRMEGFHCPPNSTVMVECNRCGCGPDGKLSWCTKKGCNINFKTPKVKRDFKAAEERLNRKGSILNPFTEEETKKPDFKCEPDSSIKVDCKRCFCGTDGKSLGFCVETSCYNPNKPSPTRNPEEYAKLERKGALLNPYTEAETKQPNFKCTPDESLKVVVTEDQCKRCICGDDGKSLPFCVDVSCYKVPKTKH